MRPAPDLATFQRQVPGFMDFYSERRARLAGPDSGFGECGLIEGEDARSRGWECRSGPYAGPCPPAQIHQNIITGTVFQRPGMNRLLDLIRAGNVVVVIARLGWAATRLVSLI